MTGVLVTVECGGRCGHVANIPGSAACDLFLENGKRDPDRLVLCVDCQIWFATMVAWATPSRISEPVPLATIEK